MGVTGRLERPPERLFSSWAEGSRKDEPSLRHAEPEQRIPRGDTAAARGGRLRLAGRGREDLDWG